MVHLLGCYERIVQLDKPKIIWWLWWLYLHENIWVWICYLFFFIVYAYFGESNCTHYESMTTDLVVGSSISAVACDSQCNKAVSTKGLAICESDQELTVEDDVARSYKIIKHCLFMGFQTVHLRNLRYILAFFYVIPSSAATVSGTGTLRFWKKQKRFQRMRVTSITKSRTSETWRRGKENDWRIKSKRK